MKLRTNKRFVGYHHHFSGSVLRYVMFTHFRQLAPRLILKVISHQLCNYFPDALVPKLQVQALLESILLRLSYLQRNPDAAEVPKLEELHQDILNAQNLCQKVSLEASSVDAMNVDQSVSPSEWNAATIENINDNLFLSNLIVLIIKKDISAVERLLCSSGDHLSLCAADYLKVAGIIESVDSIASSSRSKALTYILMGKAIEILAQSEQKSDFIAAVRACCALARRKDSLQEALGILENVRQMAASDLFELSKESLSAELRWIVSSSHNRAIECWKRNDKPAAQAWIVLAANMKQYLSPEDQKIGDFQRVETAFSVINPT